MREREFHLSKRAKRKGRPEPPCRASVERDLNLIE
jgi:hypothetical protein